MTFHFHPRAELELAEAADYYEARVAGLGVEFISEVERVLALLEELPNIGERLDDRHYRIAVRRFPHGVIFRRDNSSTLIMAIAHRRRRPNYWMPRVQDGV